VHEQSLLRELGREANATAMRRILAALFRRFANTCERRVGSLSSGKIQSGSSTVSSCWAASKSGRVVSSALCNTARKSTRCFCSVTLPSVTREMSSRSSTMRTM
jgi:hypothetical protein